jgi:hypothetical protein
VWNVIFLPLINPLNAKLNPICHLLALLGAHPIFHVSRIRVNYLPCFIKIKCSTAWSCNVFVTTSYSSSLDWSLLSATLTTVHCELHFELEKSHNEVCVAVLSSEALCSTIHYLVLAQNSVLI